MKVILLMMKTMHQRSVTNQVVAVECLKLSQENKNVKMKLNGATTSLQIAQKSVLRKFAKTFVDCVQVNSVHIKIKQFVIISDNIISEYGYYDISPC